MQSTRLITQLNLRLSFFPCFHSQAERATTSHISYADFLVYDLNSEGVQFNMRHLTITNWGLLLKSHMKPCKILGGYSKKIEKF